MIKILFINHKLINYILLGAASTSSAVDSSSSTNNINTATKSPNRRGPKRKPRDENGNIIRTVAKKLDFQ